MARKIETRMQADDAEALFEALRNENEELRCELMRLGEEIQSYARIERLLRSADAEEPRRSRREGRQRGMSGRPNLPADIWAWLQVNQHQRPMNEVYKEWLARSDVCERDLQDPKRQFNRITKPEWGE